MLCGTVLHEARHASQHFENARLFGAMENRHASAFFTLGEVAVRSPLMISEVVAFRTLCNPSAFLRWEAKTTTQQPNCQSTAFASHIAR